MCCALPDTKGFWGHRGPADCVCGRDWSWRGSVWAGSGVQSYLKEQPSRMPERLEAGTANVHGIAGLLAAVRWLERTGISVIRERETKLAQQFYLGIRSAEGGYRIRRCGGYPAGKSCAGDRIEYRRCGL